MKLPRSSTDRGKPGREKQGVSVPLDNRVHAGIGERVGDRAVIGRTLALPSLIPPVRIPPVKEISAASRVGAGRGSALRQVHAVAIDALPKWDGVLTICASRLERGTWGTTHMSS